jgi:hypothetical protein
MKNGSRRVKVDWVKVQTEYVAHQHLTLNDVAEKFGISVKAVNGRATTEKWSEKRKEFTSKQLAAALDKAAAANVIDLSACNERHLKLSNDICDKIAQMLERPELMPTDVRSLASALESAQRVARLALGASTERIEEAGISIEGVELEYLTDEEAGTLETLLGKAVHRTTSGQPPAKGDPIQ